MNMPQTKPIRVMLICDQQIVTWGFEKLVQSTHPCLELAATAEDYSAAALMLATTTVDVILLDLDGRNSVEIIPPLNALSAAKVLAMTSSRELELRDSAVVAGAKGVVTKSEPAETFIKAITKVNEGEIWIDRSATGRIFQKLSERKTWRFDAANHQKIGTLTRRERETVSEIVKDAAAGGRLIAQRLNISENTLRNHLNSIYSKLGLSSRLELFAYAKLHAIADKA
jgi:two-component system, NarL family, nitrate/nitrite response regulator NarL